jgi:hypothetical protein
VESQPHEDCTNSLETNVGPAMNAVWLVVGAAAIFAIVVLIRSWQRRSSPEDMGAVSHQWVNEHRLGHQNDSRRA